MNTREKIWAVSELEQRIDGVAGDWIAVGGRFDPLTAAEAQMLAHHARTGKNLLAFVLNTADALLATEARAVLVAALRDVNGVVTGTLAEWRQLQAQGRLQCVDEFERDRQRTEEFVEFVLRRQASEAVPAGEAR